MGEEIKRARALQAELEATQRRLILESERRRVQVRPARGLELGARLAAFLRGIGRLANEIGARVGRLRGGWRSRPASH